MYISAQMRNPAEVRGACYGPSNSRILASNYGEPFRPAKSLAGKWKPQRTEDFTLLLAVGCSCCYCCMSAHAVPRASHHPSSSLQRGSHGTAVVAHHPFGMTTDGAFCVCVRALIPVNLGTRNEHTHNLKTVGIGCCAGGRTTTTRISSHFLGV